MVTLRLLLRSWMNSLALLGLGNLHVWKNADRLVHRGAWAALRGRVQRLFKVRMLKVTHTFLDKVGFWFMALLKHFGQGEIFDSVTSTYSDLRGLEVWDRVCLLNFQLIITKHAINTLFLFNIWERLNQCNLFWSPLNMSFGALHWGNSVFYNSLNGPRG